MYLLRSQLLTRKPSLRFKTWKVGKSCLGAATSRAMQKMRGTLLGIGANKSVGSVILSFNTLYGGSSIDER